MNTARRVQGTRDGHDDPSREGALEENNDPKMDPALQAAHWARSGGRSEGQGGNCHHPR